MKQRSEMVERKRARREGGFFFKKKNKMAASSHRVIFMGVGFKKKNLLETPSVRFFGRFQLTWRPPRGARKRFFNMETPLFLNFFVP
jgi:hypothetical protein